MLKYVSALSGALNIHAAFTTAVGQQSSTPDVKRDAFRSLAGLGAKSSVIQRYECSACNNMYRKTVTCNAAQIDSHTSLR